MKSRQIFQIQLAASKAIDRQKGIIEGVSVITKGLAAGYGALIDEVMLDQVLECTKKFPKGVKVKMDHGGGFSSIIGTLTGFRKDEDRVRADLQLFKEHPHYAATVEIIDQLSESIGLSLSFSGAEEEVNGIRHARCVEIYSIDLVSEPAANPNGLFSTSIDSTQTSDMNFDDFVSTAKKIFGVQEPPMNKELEQANAQLAELRSQMETQRTELQAAQEKLKTLALEHDKSMKELEASVEAKANLKALEIAKKQGTPVPVKDNAATATNLSNPYEEYRRLQNENPVKATLFWREHRNEIIALR